MSQSSGSPKAKRVCAEEKEGREGEEGDDGLVVVGGGSRRLGKNNIQAVNWFFTLNNPVHPSYKDRLLELFRQHASYCVFQLEQGAVGTKHYQGAVSFSKRWYLTQIRRVFVFRADDGSYSLNGLIHWEATRNRFAARSYCCKEAGRLDGPWYVGHSNGVKASGFAEALVANSRESAESLIKSTHPDKFFCAFGQIQNALNYVFKPLLPEYYPRYNFMSFSNIPEVDAWFDSNVFMREDPDRTKLLYIYGATRLGKTQYIRSYGKHLYFTGVMKYDEFEQDLSGYEYMIIDDIELRYVLGAKTLLLGRGMQNMTDKYKKKFTANVMLPTVYISNNSPQEEFGFVDLPFWEENMVVVCVKEKLF